MKPTSDSKALDTTTAANGHRPASPDALVADIERTRAELARTIDAIADRVNPANIARRAADRARERITQIDPMVAGAAVVAVTAATAAWFLLRGRKKKLSRRLRQVLVL
jgi:Protein of unknown function (DUF3618)